MYRTRPQFTQIPVGLYVKWGSGTSKPISEKDQPELQKMARPGR